MSSALSKLECLRENSAGAARNADDVAGMAAVGADYVTDDTSIADIGPQPQLVHALVTTVTVLIIACTCALGLATTNIAPNS